MAAPEWTPTSADVAAELPQRVKDSNGNTLADFSDDTEPTKAQVDLIIPKAVGDVASRIGTLASCMADEDTLDEMKASASSAATIRAAMRVERTFFSDQIGSRRSPYDALRDEYKDLMTALVESVAENCGSGGGGESVGGAGTQVSADFPCATPWGTASW